MTSPMRPKFSGESPSPTSNRVWGPRKALRRHLGRNPILETNAIIISCHWSAGPMKPSCLNILMRTFPVGDGGPEPPILDGRGEGKDGGHGGKVPTARTDPDTNPAKSI